MSLAQLSRQRAIAQTASASPIRAQAPPAVFHVEYPPNKEELTMKQISEIEWAAIEAALRRAVVQED